MREIEVKAKVKNIEQLITTLEAAGVKLSAPLKQHDVVWFEAGASLGDMAGKNVVRIRTENDTKSIFTLKQTIAHLDKLEHETIIENPVEMRTAIELMHYKLFTEITKTRRKTQIGDIEICIDDVNNLGTFIEAEKLCADDVDGDAVRNELWRLLEQFAISKKDEVTKGYDILMREKLTTAEAS